VEIDTVRAYFAALYDHCETTEELLAAQCVQAGAYSEMRRAPTRQWSEWAAIKWPWGDARGLLRAGGRSYWEARLRLRDALVKSAREVVKGE
jgi:hypothetical protein